MSQAEENAILLGDDSDDDIQVVSVVQGTGIIPPRPIFPLQMIPNTGVPKHEPVDMSDVSVSIPGANVSNATFEANPGPFPERIGADSSSATGEVVHTDQSMSVEGHNVHVGRLGEGVVPSNGRVLSEELGQAPNTNWNQAHEQVSQAHMQISNSSVSSTPVPNVELCVVCGDFAVGIRYGAMSCDNCATFFQRCIRESAQFQCEQDQRCSITKANDDCHYCWLRKCMASGMSKFAPEAGVLPVHPSNIKADLDMVVSQSSKPSYEESPVEENLPFPPDHPVETRMSPYQHASLYSIQPSPHLTDVEESIYSAQDAPYPTQLIPHPVHSVSDNHPAMSTNSLDLMDVKPRITTSVPPASSFEANSADSTNESTAITDISSNDPHLLSPAVYYNNAVCSGTEVPGQVMSQQPDSSGYKPLQPETSEDGEEMDSAGENGEEDVDVEGEEEEKVSKAKKRGRKPKTKQPKPSPSKRFFCLSCPRIFHEKALFLKHKKICPANEDDSSGDGQEESKEFIFRAGSYKCKHCNFRTTHKGAVARHVMKHDKRFKCPVCRKYLGSYALLMRHKSIAHGTQGVLSKSLGTPLKRSNLPLEFTCQECPLVCKTKYLLSLHMGAHRNPQNRPCKICNRPLHKTQIMSHINTEHKSSLSPAKKSLIKRPALSKQASKTQTQNVILGYRRKKNGNFVCKPCEYSAQNRQTFRAHIHSVRHKQNLDNGDKGDKVAVLQGYHRGKNGKFVCKLCDYSSDVQEYFVGHLWTVKHRQAVPGGSAPEQDVNVVAGYGRQKNGNFVCKPCDYRTEIPISFAKHLATERHEKTIADEKQEKSVSDDEKDEQVDVVEGCRRNKNGDFHCTFCQFSVVRPIDMARHLHGMSHKKNMQDRAKEEKYICEPCDYSTKKLKQYFQHLETVDHKRKEARMRSGRKRSCSSSEDSATSIKQTRSQKKSASPLKRQTRNDTLTSTQARIDHLTMTRKKETVKDEEIPEEADMPDSVSPESSSVRNLENEWERTGKKTVDLVTDFTDFALRPYACALCFYRTGKLDELQTHTLNHLTGGAGVSTEDGNFVSTSGLAESNLNQIPSIPFSFSQSPVQSPGNHGNLVSSSYSSPPNRMPQSNRNTGSASVSMNQPTLPQPGFVGTPVSMNQSTFPGTPANMINQSNFSQPNYIARRPYSMPPNSHQLAHQSTRINPGMAVYPNTPQPHLRQMRTDDLIDPGLDYVKDPSNPNPYQCLYCRWRVQSFMVLVGHFDSYHFNIVRAKNEQAAMRFEAARTARAAIVKSEVIDLDED